MAGYGTFGPTMDTEATSATSARDVGPLDGGEVGEIGEPQAYYGDEVSGGDVEAVPGPSHARVVGAETVEAQEAEDATPLEPTETEMAAARAAASPTASPEPEIGRAHSKNLLSSSAHPAQTLDLTGVSAPRFYFSHPWSRIIFENKTSEARDLDAAERNFLSLLRTSMSLGLIGAAVLCNYRLPNGHNNQGGGKFVLESKVSTPLGLLFLALSLVGFVTSGHNYIVTVTSYAKERANVKMTWSAWAHLMVASLAVLATTIIFLVVAY